MNGWINGGVDGWINGSKDGWINGSKDGRVGRKGAGGEEPRLINNPKSHFPWQTGYQI